MSVTIVNHPSRVVTHLAPDSGIYDVAELADRKKRIAALASGRTRIICYAMDAFWLELFPAWMIEGGAGLVTHKLVRAHLERSPLLAVQLLLSSYDETQPMLERVVLSSGEATVPLLLAIDDGTIEPRRPRHVYEEALLAQPWWGLQYASSGRVRPEAMTQRADFYARLKQRAEAGAANEGQAALVHLTLNAQIHPKGFKTALMSDPMTAFLASRLLGPRGFTGSAEDVQGLDARWATHIALWSSLDERTCERVINAIATHPGWAGEYIAREEQQQKNWAWVADIYARSEAFCQANASSPPLPWSDLLWAMLDRISLSLEKKDPKVTFAQSYARARAAEGAAAAKPETVAEKS